MDDSKSNKVIEINKAKNASERPYHSKHGNYKPDEDLLQSTARIKSQRDVIQERIAKMESANQKVSKTVFDKVRRDYALQLQTISELLDEKKESLKKEVKELYVRREKLSVEINRHKEILEEAEFRHHLGEFSQSQYQEVENYETKEIEKLESDLARISQFIHAHEELFDPEDLGLPAEQKKTADESKEVTKTVAKETPAEKPAEKIQVGTPVKEEAPKEEQKAAPTPPDEAPAAEKEQDEIQTDANEFEDLFLDEEEDSEKAKLAESQSKINALIDEEKSDKTDKSDEDYFKQDKVDESSFTVKKSAVTHDDTPEEHTPKPGKEPEQEASEDIKTDVRIKAEESAKSKVPDDSISDILDSINIDDAAPAEAKKEEEKEIPIEMASADAEYILTLTEGELEQKEYPLKENTSIGRSPSNDVVLKAPKVSRQHAAINMYNNQFIIIDLKSSNGVYVNGAKVDESVLNDGDEVSVGGYKFLFSKK